MSDTEFDNVIEKAKIEAKVNDIRDAFKDSAIEENDIATMTVDGKGHQEYAFLYHRITGAKKAVLPTMLTQRLGQRFSNTDGVPTEYIGKKVWSDIPVDVVDTSQNLKCHLHPDSDMRDQMVSVGLGQTKCRKSNIPNEYELLRHMEKKHRGEYATYKDTVEKRELREERDRMAALLEKLTESQVQNTKPKKA
jgi:hypothetical protein